MKTKVLVCGGAGYIGSHVVREIIRSRSDSFELVILDNLSTGHKESIPDGVPLEVGDIRDMNFLDAVFLKHKPDLVVHLCASISVAESVRDPLMYYDNNVSGTVNMIRTMVKHNVKRFIFSSTAALFGYPDNDSIKEDDAKKPINPYGETKLVVENMLHWCDEAYGLKSVCLRYFNACGADKSGLIGEAHDDETHLIPLVLQVPLGQRPHISIFGTDYRTPDGSCIRDYVHVTDIATAHILSADYLAAKNQSNAFNLGSGRGYSVREIVDAARRVTGHAIPALEKERRGGDPDRLVASSDKAESVLGWKRQYTTIEAIIESAWQWHKAHPKGF
ncbi:hypothetical protein DFJ73DRAFT_659577 [Zopfochytrium polystomum]|nr:hypothetical protein DFJ73DRAFT_659577 [Zopfochytrium polystomum]